MSVPHATPGKITASYNGEPRGSAYDAWLGQVWCQFGRVDPEPTSKDQFACRAEFSQVGGLRLATAQSTSARYRRSTRLLSDQCDDFLLFRADAGSVEVTQKGSTVELRPSEMALGEMCRETTLLAAEGSAFTSICIPRRDLLCVCPDAEQRLARKLDGNPAVRQAVTSYLTLLNDVGAALDPAAQRRLAQHTVDMVGALLDGHVRREATDAAGGSTTARMQLVQRYILDNLTDPALSIGAVAAHLGCHPKQVQRLFAASGRTFAEFVLEERLQLARRKIVGANGPSEKISSIAFDVGFGDLAYFNRAFRTRFGMTPSESRERLMAA